MWHKEGKIFNSWTAIRESLPNVSLPAILSDDVIRDFGFKEVLQTPAPAITDLQIASQDGVEFLPDGTVRTKWVVTDIASDNSDHKRV